MPGYWKYPIWALATVLAVSFLRALRQAALIFVPAQALQEPFDRDSVVLLRERAEALAPVSAEGTRVFCPSLYGSFYERFSV